MLFDQIKKTQKYVEPTIPQKLLSRCALPGGMPPHEVAEFGAAHGLNWSLIMAQVNKLISEKKLERTPEGNFRAAQEKQR